MKKVLTAILALVYFAVSSGVVMEVHYCMGKVAGAELYTGDNDHCGKCGMKEKKGGCCQDEFKVYKLEDSHKNVTNNIQFGTDAAMVPQVFALDKQLLPVETISAGLNNYTPPPDTGPSLCILNCVFRI